MKKSGSIVIFIFCCIMTHSACVSAERRAQNLPESIQVVRVERDVTGKTSRQPTTLKKPSGFKPAGPDRIAFGDDRVNVLCYARSFAQGNAVYAEIEKKPAVNELSEVSFLYNGANVPLTKTPWGYRAILAISPEQKPGDVIFRINYTADLKTGSTEKTVKIKKVDFPVSRERLDVGDFSNKSYTGDPKFKKKIEECSALRVKAFSASSEDAITGSLSHPRDMHRITSVYWKKRIYLTYAMKGKKRVMKPGRTSYHRGLDLKGDVGTPVFAMADGTVVLSHEMFYEGNMVVIDHGNRIFTYYQHMDKLEVAEGQKVTAGTLIGRTGKTGMVTGPHLHVALSIRGIHVDPLSLLYLPVSR